MSPILSDLDDIGHRVEGGAKLDNAACNADACNQGRKSCPCPEACTVAPRERMGGFHGWERFLIEHPTAVAVLSLAAFALLIWAGKP